jgi:hypothetical protein
MAISQRQEERALSADERDLVAKSHHPALQELSDKDLANLLKLVRERREKAQTEASQRRREIRGKGEAKGAERSKADEGSRLKVSVLAMAVRRVNNETERRRRMGARVDLISNARRALALKEGSESDTADFNTRTAHQGLRSVPNQRADSLINPMERGRLRKQHAVAQAKRDAR